MLRHLKVSQRIALGQGLLVTLLVLVGGTGVAALYSAVDIFSGYRATARDSNLAARVEVGVLEARLAVKDFLLTGSDADLARVRAGLGAVNGALSDAGEAFEDPTRRRLLADARAALANYEAAFAEVATAAQAGDKPAVNRAVEGGLNPNGARVTHATDEIRASLVADQDRIGPAAVAAIRDAELGVLGLGVVALLAGAAGSVLVSRSVTRPLRGLTAAMGRLAAGDLDTAVPFAGARDEVGDMARAVRVFREGLVENRRLAAAEEAGQLARGRRAAAVDALVTGFDREASGGLRAVAAAAAGLEATARSMAAIAEGTSTQAGSAAAAAGQTTANVQAVASAAEEMAASIREIAAQVAHSKAVADRAAGDVARADVTGRGLAEAARRIGQVVDLIGAVAGQTNLLALNATIEAARAGDAGKGFAVVAAEVKGLAGQTARATEEVAAQVAAVRQAAAEVLGAIRSVGGVIAQVNEVSASVAAAMEQQGASTQEISRAVAQAAAGTREVAGSVAQVTDAAGQTGAAAAQVLGASGELSRQSEALRAQVERFLAGIRAA